MTHNILFTQQSCRETALKIRSLQDDRERTFACGTGKGGSQSVRRYSRLRNSSREHGGLCDIVVEGDPLEEVAQIVRGDAADGGLEGLVRHARLESEAGR